jgi:peptidoglycan/xylan/chitin deacetylase (PgdA/CDA1 family)
MSRLPDRFDDHTYFDLLERLARTHRPVRFVDLREGTPPEPFFILRHDVDYSTAAALRLARLEAERGLRATFFLLPSSLYYNLLHPDHAGVAPALVDLGHEVGLHYDVEFFRPFPRERWRELLLEQASLLARLSGAPVESIAMHQPALKGPDPFQGWDRFLNAYDDRFFREMAYVSDSCRAWRDAAWEMLAGGRIPPRLQLVLHPVNWSPSDRDRMAIFRGVHDDVRSVLDRAQADLLQKISRHTGVLEHEARAERERASRPMRA